MKESEPPKQFKESEIDNEFGFSVLEIDAVNELINQIERDIELNTQKMDGLQNELDVCEDIKLHYISKMSAAPNDRLEEGMKENDKHIETLKRQLENLEPVLAELFKRKATLEDSIMKLSTLAEHKKGTLH